MTEMTAIAALVEMVDTDTLSVADETAFNAAIVAAKTDAKTDAAKTDFAKNVTKFGMRNDVEDAADYVVEQFQRPMSELKGTASAGLSDAAATDIAWDVIASAIELVAARADGPLPSWVVDAIDHPSYAVDADYIGNRDKRAKRVVNAAWTKRRANNDAPFAGFPVTAETVVRLGGIATLSETAADIRANYDGAQNYQPGSFDRAWNTGKVPDGVRAVRVDSEGNETSDETGQKGWAIAD